MDGWAPAGCWPPEPCARPCLPASPHPPTRRHTRAQVTPVTQGAIPIDKVFGKEAQALISKLNIEGQHRGAVAAARTLEAQEEAAAGAEAAGEQQQQEQHAHGHTHSHGHKHGHKHAHEHEHKHDDCAACQTGEHAHAHKHDDCAACQTGEGEHAHGDCATCKEEEGAGHAHGHHHHHSHSHSHKQRQETTAARRFGIKSFVYARRRPFHPQR